MTVLRLHFSVNVCRFKVVLSGFMRRCTIHLRSTYQYTESLITQIVIVEYYFKTVLCFCLSFCLHLFKLESHFIVVCKISVVFCKRL